MRKISTLTSLAVLGVALLAGLALVPRMSSNDSSAQSTLQQQEEGYETGISEYKSWMLELQKDPVSGTITPEHIELALTGLREAKVASAANRDLGLDWTFMGPSNIGGRSRGFLISSSNPDRMYLGSVSGGLYVTDNAGLSWYPHPQNETFNSLLVVTIVESANGDIYFGTGESNIGLFDGSASFTHMFTGAGVYKSTDGGTTFDLLPATDPVGDFAASTGAEWAYVNRLATHPTDNNVVMAATRLGLKHSNDGGATWTEAQAGNARDVIFGSDGICHAILGRKYFKSSDSSTPNVLAENADISTQLLPTSRTVVTVAPSDPSYVYLYAASSDESMEGVWQSVDGGDTFTRIAADADSDGLFNPPGGQGDYNLCIGVNSADPGRIYIGGQVSAWSWSQSSGAWDQIAISGGGPLFSKYIHADHHFIVPHPSNPDILYFATDGGLFRSINATAQFPDFSDLNKGFGTMQMHGIGAGINGEVMGGSQDNGTAIVDFTGNSVTESRDVLGGDGGEAEISKIRPDFLFASFFDFTAGGSGLRRSGNGGNSFANMFDLNIDADQNGVATGGTEFVETDYLWEDMPRWFTFNKVLAGETVTFEGNDYVEGDVVTFQGQTFELTAANLYNSYFLYGTNSGVWITTEALKNSTEGPPTWFEVTGDTLSTSIGNVTAIDVVEQGNIAYIGTSAGDLWRVGNMRNTIWEYDADENWDEDDAGLSAVRIYNGSGRITGVSVDRNDPSHVVITFAGFNNDNNVWRATNCENAAFDAANFTNIAGGLPAIPAFDCLINYYDGNSVLVATEFGVWSYDISSPGTWTHENTELGSVPTFEIRQEMMLESDCRPIYIGTHGRGMWRATNHVPESLNCDFARGGNIEGDDILIQEDIVGKMSLRPNPASRASVVTVDLNKVSDVTVSVYDLTGKMMTTVVEDARFGFGTHNFEINTADLPNGTYLVVVSTPDQIRSQKLVVMH